MLTGDRNDLHLIGQWLEEKNSIGTIFERGFPTFYLKSMDTARSLNYDLG